MGKFTGLKKVPKKRQHGKENSIPDPFNNSLLENILGDNINDVVGRRSDVGKRSLRVDADDSIEDVEINDDALEKEAHRRRLEEEREKEKQRAAASRQPTLSLLNNLSQAELDQHYSKCIEMCNRNKVNVKNAFKLQLIDYMKLIVSNQSTKSENLTLMSCTLGASAKIYAHRVDKVYSDMVKIVSGKGEVEKENESEEESAGKDDDVEVRAKRKRTSHVDSDEELDDKEKLDMEKMLVSESQLDKWKGESEPIEKGALKQSQEYFVESRQLDSNGRFNLVPPLFSAQRFNKPPNIGNFSFHDEYYEGDYPDLEVASLIADYNHIDKHYSIYGEEDEVSENSAMLNSSLAFDPSSEVDIAESIRLNQDEDMELDDREDGEEWIGDYDEDVDSDKENKSKEDVSKKDVQSFNAPSLARFVTPLAGDYLFFDKSRIDFWAGPRHWTIRKPKGGERVPKAACEQLKRTVKKNVNIEFTEERTKDVKRYYSDCVNAVLTRKTMMTWSARKCKVPHDVSFTQKMLLSIMKNEKFLYVRNDSSNIMIGFCDLNSQDNTLLTPDDFGGEVEDGDDDFDDREDEDNCLRFGDDRAPSPLPVEPDSPSSSSHTDLTSQLLPQPQKVEKVNLKFAKAQKKIDIKLLKTKIWESMGLEPKSGKEVNFSKVYGSLGDMLPTEEASELSFPIAFMALLHMANERSLALTGNQDYSDVSVTQP